MKHFSVAFASFCAVSTFSFAAAQNTTQLELQALEQVLPACSAECLVTVAPEYNCSPLDSSCICTNSDLTTAYVACIKETCTTKQVLLTIKLGAEGCGAPVRNKGPRLRAACWSLASLAILSIALRFCARTSALDGPGYGWDDWIMLLVLVFFIPEEVAVDLLIQNGMGQDFWMLAPHWNEITAFWFFVWMTIMCYAVVTNLTKIAILLLYLRIFPSTVANWFRITCFGIIGICVASAIGEALSVAFECNPVPGAWHNWDGEGSYKCINIKTQFLAMDGVAIFFDLLIFTLPIPKIIQLQASWRKRLGICLTFLVGLFVTGSRIVRVTQLITLVYSPNPTWDVSNFALWIEAEVCLGIVCACMPSFPRLIRIAWKKTSDSITSRSGGSSANRNLRISRPDGSQVEAQGPVISAPIRGLAKTVETTVYSREMNSSDEVELMDRSPSTAMDDSYHFQPHQHSYVREW